MKLDGNKNIDQEILDEIDQELTYESSEEESHSGSESGSEYTSGGDGDVDDLPMKTMEVDEDRLVLMSTFTPSTFFYSFSNVVFYYLKCFFGRIRDRD